MTNLSREIQDAITNGNREAVRRWLDGGGDPNAMEEVSGCSALIYSMVGGHSEVFEMLLAAGATPDPDPADDGTDAPLVHAIMQGRLDFAEALVRAGASIDQKDDLGATALMWAREASVVDWLAERGADLDAQDEDGTTAVHSAVNREDVGVLAALLRCGASVEIRDEDGQTAIEMAEAEGYSKSLAVLRGEEPPPNDTADIARCELTALEFARTLVSGNFDGAFQMLAPALRKKSSADRLKAAYDKMVLPEDDPPEDVEVLQSMNDWPDKRRSDLGWAYVSISGPDYNEAVTVVVTDAGQVRTIEWGRP